MKRTPPKVVGVDAFRGLSNIATTERLPSGALAEATNVDVSNVGSIRTRAGYTKVYSGTLCHSLYAIPNTDIVMFVDSGYLKLFTAQQQIPQTIMGPDIAELSYTYFNNTVYMASSDNKYYKYDLNTKVITNWLLPPMLLNTVEVGNGQLHAGIYTIAISLVGDDGVEYGLSDQISLSLEEQSGLQITDCDLPTGYLGDADYTFNVYLTTTDGSELYLYDTYKQSELPVKIHNPVVSGTTHPTPDATIISNTGILETVGGRLYIADGKTIYYTGMYAPNSLEPHKGFMSFEKEITNICPVYDGFYVIADGIHYIRGFSPASMNKEKLNDVTGVKGSATELLDTYFMRDRVPTGDKWIVTTDKGIYVLAAEGQIYNLTERVHMLGIQAPAVAASFIQSTDGSPRYVMTIRESGRKDMDRGLLSDTFSYSVVRR